MPKHIHSNLSVSEKAQINNASSDVSKVKDNSPRDASIVDLIREKESLTHEIKILRCTISIILDKIGLKVEEFSEYNDYIEQCIKEVPEMEEKKD